MEKKEKGEFQPEGSMDVLSTVLQTPEHSGRVRGVGGFVTPSLFFNLPKEKRTRITKAELLARDRQRDEEMERIKKEFTTQIESLKAAVSGSGKFSPLLSEKASCHGVTEEGMEKPIVVKELVLDNDDCVAFDTPPSQPKVIIKPSDYMW